ncbi:MAG: ABC transporter ATP-binding protein [Clostridia bacterium]|nr:ABC transporter ATP-binding protein [Clostridia bacterium]
MSAIEVKGLTKAFGDVLAVDDLTFSVEEGEFFALLGVNGAGKTTAIRLLTCLSRADAGEAFLAGHSVSDEEQAVKTLCNVSPQETAIATRLSVRENLLLIARLYGATKEEAERRTDAMIKRMGLGEVAARRAGVLSGGWQRRLSIAMALISEPKILFLDEPTLGLDVLARRELWGILRDLKGKITVVLTTHYLEEAEALADRIGILSRGRMVACDTADALKARAGKDNFEEAFIALATGEVIA